MHNESGQTNYSNHYNQSRGSSRLCQDVDLKPGLMGPEIKTDVSGAMEELRVAMEAIDATVNNVSRLLVLVLRKGDSQKEPDKSPYEPEPPSSTTPLGNSLRCFANTLRGIHGDLLDIVNRISV